MPFGGVDLTDDPAGRATAFASGCLSTFLFVRNAIMKPALKSCQQRCTDLEKGHEWLKAQLALKDGRIHDLEMALYNSGIPNLRNAVQAAISETQALISDNKKRLNELEGKKE